MEKIRRVIWSAEYLARKESKRRCSFGLTMCLILMVFPHEYKQTKLLWWELGIEQPKNYSGKQKRKKEDASREKKEKRAHAFSAVSSTQKIQVGKFYKYIQKIKI